MDIHNTREILLREATLSNNLDEVKRLIAVGVNVDATVSGYTALYTAISAHHERSYDTVRLLLESGSDPNRKQGLPYAATTPLALAVAHSLISIIELLLRAGADINTAYALHVATKRFNVAVMRMLVEWGGDVKLSSPDQAWGKFPIDAFEGILSYYQRMNKPLPNEETIQEIRRLLAV